MSVSRAWQVEYACGWNLYTMRIMGLWPEERRFDRISSYIVLIGIFFIVLFCTIPQSIQLYLISGNFDLVMDILSLDVLNCTVALFKMIFFWASGKQMKDLLNAMEQDWNEVLSKQDEREMRKLAKFSRILATSTTAICFLLISVFVIKRILTIRIDGKLMLFTAVFPYDAMVSPMYEVTFVCQLIGAIYYTTSYTAVDTFLAMLVLHSCGQLTRLRNNLVDLKSSTKKEFQIKLTYIVRRHDHLNRFVETIDDRFNIMLLIQMLGCTVQLCTECFQGLLITAGEDQDMPLVEIFFFAFYIVYVLLQLYLYCYVGEKLWFESSEVANAAYECRWYDLLPNEARSLMLIIRRARSPLSLTAARFCTFNHELYSSVLKTSMSYLSVLRATMV